MRSEGSFGHDLLLQSDRRRSEMTELCILVAAVVPGLVRPLGDFTPIDFVASSRTVFFPVGKELNRERVQALRLMVSTDNGKSWGVADSIGSSQLLPQQVGWVVIERLGWHLAFRAPADGLYWITIETEFKNGTKLPATLSGPPSVRLRIITKPAD